MVFKHDLEIVLILYRWRVSTPLPYTVLVDSVDFYELGDAAGRLNYQYYLTQAMERANF